jgi:hypothetical protein
VATASNQGHRLKKPFTLAPPDQLLVIGKFGKILEKVNQTPV